MLLQRVLLRSSGLRAVASAAAAAPASTSSSSVGYQTARVSKLANGLRVASVGGVTGSAFVGAFVAAGSRAESHDASGVTHFLSRVGFARTKDAQVAVVARQLDNLGADVTVVPERDFIAYGASVNASRVPEVIEAIADQLAGADLRGHELGDARDLVRDDVRAASSPSTVQLDEAVHAAAFGHATLGRPVTCPSWNVEQLTVDDLVEYRQTHFAADRIVLVGHGVSHDDLLAAAAPLEAVEPRAAIETVPEAAVYTGGEVRQAGVGDRVSVALVFEGPALSQPAEVAASLVLQSILGAGASGDALSPGMGVASRLHQNVVLRHEDSIDTTSAMSLSYADSGLFGVSATGSGAISAEIVHALSAELKNMSANLSDDEFKRGVAQAKARVLEARAHRGTHAGLLARSILGTGEASDDMLVRLDQLTAKDLTTVAKKITSSPLTFVAVGDGLDNLPSYSSIASAF